MSNTLNVTQQTTVRDLRNFLEGQGADASSRLRGKPTANGGYTLYLDKGSSSLFDRMTGKANDRNKAAEAGVKMVFDNFQTLARRNGMDPAQRSGELLVQINKRLPMDGRHALRGDAVLHLAKGANLVGTKLGFQPGALPPRDKTEEKKTVANGPQVALNFSDKAIMDMTGAILAARDATGRDAAVQLIANRIEQAIGTAAIPAADKRALAMSLGTSVKSEVTTAVSQLAARHRATLPGDMAALVDRAFDQAGSAVLGTRQVGDFTPTAIIQNGATVNIDLPKIEINNKTYEATRHLGGGGFGEVYLYADLQNPADTIAFKICKTDQNSRLPDMVRGETMQEVLAHEKAQTGASPNVLKLEGAVRLSSGVIGIALESAPNGSVFDFATTLKNHVGAGPGKLTTQEAKVVQLTILQDIIKGLKSVQDQGMMHLDFKSPNCMIGADGKAKIIDFGTSTTAASIALRDNPSTDNPRYLSPEYLTGATAVDSLTKAKHALIKDDLQPALKAMFPNLKDASQNKLTLFCMEGVTQRDEDNAANRLNLSLDSAHDTWGAGMVALDLFSGREPLRQYGHNVDVADHIENWASGGANKALSPHTSGAVPATALGLSTGDAVVDDLINKMLAPDPRDRFTVDDALAHKAFRLAGVGDAATHDFVKVLLADRKPFADRLDVEADIATATAALDYKLRREYDTSLSPADRQLLESGTASMADRKAIAATLATDEQAALQTRFNSLDQLQVKLNTVDQAIAAAEAQIAAGKGAFTAGLTPSLRQARGVIG